MNFMLRIFFVILLFASFNFSQAATICTMVFDVNEKSFILNEGKCDQSISPASTFKIPLSLMGYDSGYLTDISLPELPFHSEYPAVLASHKHETSPQYWMKNSVVWYSQIFTEWLGMKRFSHYVTAFHYGNQDLSGDAGKNNGLTHAWLSSSLKITPREQLQFLQQFLDRELPIKTEAYEYTEQLLKLDPKFDAYTVYGKTGTVLTPMDDHGVLLKDRQFGWFIGWVNLNDQVFIFVNLIDEPKIENIFAGAKAKENMLNRMKSILSGKVAS